MSSASLIKTPPQKVTVNGWVFYTSTALILLLTAILIIAPEEAGRILGVAQEWLSRSFGWYYMVVIAAYLIFVVALAFSSYGKLKLGTRQDTPDFSYGAWAGMLFSSGIGISLLYFGASEPLDHYFNPPEGVSGSHEAARQALQLTQTVVQRFMDKHVTSALEDAAAQLRSQGLDVQTLLGSAKRCMGVRVEMEEGNPFVYEVSLDGYLAAPSESEQDEVRSRYYRAEVYLHNGNQKYDLMGFAQEQISRDVLDQFESHRQLLGRVYS